MLLTTKPSDSKRNLQAQQTQSGYPSQRACKDRLLPHSQHTDFPDSERLAAPQILKPELYSHPSSCCLQPGSQACHCSEAVQDNTQVGF